jgi:hypothetical protein
MKNLNSNISSSRILKTILLSTVLFLYSCGNSRKNPIIPGIDGPRVDLQQDQVVISMVLEEISIIGGGAYTIPDYPNSFIEVSPDLQSPGTLVKVSLAIEDILGDFTHLDPQALPDGRPLPGVASGKLPVLAVTIPELDDLSFYIGPDIFGLFVPISGLGFQQGVVTFRFYTGSSRAGNISIVGEDQNGENSGLLLMLDLKSRTKKLLKMVDRRF